MQIIYICIFIRNCCVDKCKNNHCTVSSRLNVWFRMVSSPITCNNPQEPHFICIVRLSCCFARGQQSDSQTEKTASTVSESFCSCSADQCFFIVQQRYQTFLSQVNPYYTWNSISLRSDLPTGLFRLSPPSKLHMPTSNRSNRKLNKMFALPPCYFKSYLEIWKIFRDVLALCNASVGPTSLFSRVRYYSL
jgi:hypothetical protein